MATISRQDHCSQCGTTDYESLHTGDQGYTACCNEPVCTAGMTCYCEPTDDQILTFRAGCAQARNFPLAQLCSAALAGDPAARARVRASWTASPTPARACADHRRSSPPARGTDFMTAIQWVPAGGSNPHAERADFPAGRRAEITPLPCCDRYPDCERPGLTGGWAWQVFTSAGQIAAGWKSGIKRARAAAAEAAAVTADSSAGPPPEGTQRRHLWREVE